MSKTRTPKKMPGVRTKLFIADETIGLGKINLLDLVGEVGSISEAARRMGMGYRRAWFLLNSMQSGFDAPLFVTERGGAGKGGAQLTSLGKELIRRYRDHVALVDQQSLGIVEWMETVQVSPDDDGREQ
jgi:molybdate transport system regulatory protein